MARATRVSILPAVAALAALFIVLPITGANATVVIAGTAPEWRYEPTQATIAVGERFAFRNETGVTHTADCVGCPWRSGDIQPGQTTFLPFEEDASFEYRCRYHPEVLVGRLTVGEGGPLPAPEASG